LRLLDCWTKGNSTKATGFQECIMITGQQCAGSGVGNPDRDPGFGLQSGAAEGESRANEARPRMTPADFFYRIATLTAIAFLLATVL
jgi:hypothetical protein